MGHHTEMDEASDTPSGRLLSSHDREDGAVVYVRERQSSWIVFATHFTCFAFGVISALAMVSVVFKMQPAQSHPPYSFASTDALPHVPTEQVIFEASPVYSAKSSDDSDYAWNMLLPPGRGYVFVDQPDARGLAPGEDTPYGPIYSVSMYHQLHCLARIRGLYWTFLDAITTGEDTIARGHTGREASAHAQHCLDYLRQAIQCNGDMTLEWPKQDGPSSGAQVDGWGIPHTCKSPTAIKDFMDRYHYNESLSFDAAGR